jgi:uncharacterized delta-60 repeat protein
VRTDLTGPGGADYPYALALQGDGKIVVGGLSQQPNSDVQPTVVRYNANGTLDATFDGDGITVVTPMPGTRSGGRIDALAVQPDGRIVAVGSGGHAVLRADGGYDFFDNDAFVTRLNPDGSRDASYGPSGTGTTITEFGSSPYLRGVALQPDGRVVAVGNSNNGQSGGYLESFVLIRLSASTAAPPVQVGSFVAPGTVPAGSPLALTADGITTSNPGATVTKVAFYVIDSFGVERFLGYGAKNAGGAWTLTSTAYLPPGPYTLLALAADSTGTVSDPLSLSLQVV